MALAQRLGVAESAIARVPLLNTPKLADPETLLDAAFKTGPSDKEAAQLLLASAILSQAQRTTEGRLAATLSLLAPLVARADPDRTLGPDGAAWRAAALPNGWRYALGSWPRIRYAWREGMRDFLLGHGPAPAPSPPARYGAAEPYAPSDMAISEALDEVTRMNPAEAEPVSVTLQETFPQPSIGFAVSALSLVVSGWALSRELSMERRMRRRG